MSGKRAAAAEEAKREAENAEGSWERAATADEAKRKAVETEAVKQAVESEEAKRRVEEAAAAAVASVSLWARRSEPGADRRSDFSFFSFSPEKF